MPRLFAASFWLAAPSLAALACNATVVERDRVETPLFVAPDGSYRLELPLGWLRDGNALTLDGRDQPTIAFNAGPVLAGADPQAIDASAPELIIAMEDELATQPGVRVIDCRSVTLGGLPAFRMHFLRTDPEAADDGQRELLICGAISGETLFAFSYEAPAGEAFARELEIFERLVASFEPLASAAGGQ